LTTGSLLPGLLRFCPSGHPTLRPAGALSTLPAPVPAPGARGAIGGLRLVVPQQLHRLVAGLAQLMRAAEAVGVDGAGLALPP
jgi:hypothetical protein